MKQRLNPSFKIFITICTFFAILNSGHIAFSQALGLNNSTPNVSSIFDAVSTSKGVLLPRMTTAQRDAIATPATGLIVYVTDKTTGFSYYDGTKWVRLYSPSSGIIKRKTADEVVCGTGGSCTQATGTTLQNDDELVIALQANESYVIDGFLFMIASNATPDCKIAFTVPTGATMTLGYHANSGDNNTNIGTDILTTSGSASVAIKSSGGSTKENPIFISGCILMGSTAGNLTLQWAQSSNSAGNTVTIKTNSYLRAQLIN
jgi:hypothetical protein